MTDRRVFRFNRSVAGGVRPEEQQRIFEKGVTTKAGGDHGFGLHLVKRFVDRWNGSVTVEALPAGGSRFTLYLPKGSGSSGGTIK